MDLRDSDDILGMPRIFLGMQTLFGDPSLRLPALSTTMTVHTALAVDKDGFLNISWLDQGFDGLWQGPLRVGSPLLTAGAPLAAFRQSPAVIAALAVGGDGALAVAWLDTDHPGWQGPGPLGGEILPPGAPVAVIRQSPSVLAALAVAQSGRAGRCLAGY